MITYTVILDIIVLCVLSVTVVFCWKLNIKITQLQSNKSEMVDFIKSLDTTIINAHKNIVSLKEATQNASEERKKYISEGTELANDLSFIIDSGNRLINRIEKAVEAAKVLDATLEAKAEKLGKLEKELYKRKRRNKNKKIGIANTSLNVSSSS
jgi:hypothetical protein